MSEQLPWTPGLPVDPTVSVPGLARLITRRPLAFVLAGGLVMIAVVGFMGSQAPAFRATATLLLRWGGSHGPQLDLIEPKSDLTAVGEMAILRSRGVAEAAVLTEPGNRPVADADRPPSLRTLVDDGRHSALASVRQLFLGGGAADGRLAAEVIGTGGARAAGPWVVEFPRYDLVRVGRPGRFGGLGDAVELPFVAGEPLQLKTCSLLLRPVGDVRGRQFVIRALSFDEAVDRLRGSVEVSELERNSGVLQVTVEDTDPLRAAAAANAVANTYIEYSARRGRGLASQTVAFIEEQLARHQGDLERAEREVARLLTDNPRSLDIEGVAAALIQRESNLHGDRVRVAVLEKAVEEAEALLDQGHADVLSRLNPDLLDPATRSLLHNIAELATDAILIDRSDESTLKRGLLARVGDVEKWTDKIEVWTTELTDIARAVESGEAAALARLGNTRSIGLDSDALTDTLLNDLATLRVQSARLRAGATAAHPQLQEMERNAADVERRLVAHLRSRITGLEEIGQAYADLLQASRMRLATHPLLERQKLGVAEGRLIELARAHLQQRLAGLRDESGVIEGEIQAIRGQLAALPQEQLALAGPTRTVASLRETVAFLMTSRQQARLSSDSAMQVAELIDPAAPPTVRTRPRTGVLLLLGALAGLLAGLLLVAALESWGGAVLDEAELAAATGLPVLVSIPAFGGSRDRQRRSFVPMRDDPDGIAADAYRSVAARLERGHHGAHVVAVTSSLPGEGKSVANVDLALALARSGRRVLLVDGDLRAPAVHRLMRIEAERGFAETLRGEIQWDQAVWSSQQEGLSVMPAGELRGASADLLAHGRLGAILREMKKEFDVIVIDVPPVHPVTDMCFFGRHVDTLLFLYRRKGPSRRVLAHALERLRGSGIRPAGAILNEGVQRVRATRSRHVGRYQYR